jgi:hypothetical protein
MTLIDASEVATCLEQRVECQGEAFESLPILLSLRLRCTSSNSETKTWLGICSILEGKFSETIEEHRTPTDSKIDSEQ